MNAVKVSTQWEDVRTCLLCESEQHAHSPFGQTVDNGELLQYRICRVCGLVFQSPRMKEDALEGFYTSGYRLYVQGFEGPSEKDLRIQHGRARTMLQFMRDAVPNVARHLDIGSSSGALMFMFASAYQCECIGIEPGDAYRSYTRNKGLRVYSNLDTLEEMDNQAFDLISMSHVLEHLPDPLKYLRRLREKWLTPQGFLLLEVPNLYGHQSFEIPHLTAFSALTLHEMLRQAGFDILKSQQHGQPRSRLIPLYLTVLARVRKDVPQSISIRSSDRGVRWRRRLGLLWRRVATALVPGWAWLPWPEIDEESKRGSYK